MKKTNLLAVILSTAIVSSCSMTAFAMPSNQIAPDAATWTSDVNADFKMEDYLQTSVNKGRNIGFRGLNSNIPAQAEEWLPGIYSSLTLPKKDTEGRDITWTSSDESVISTNGTYVQPKKTTSVTLTATAGESGEYSKEFKFRAYGKNVLVDRAPSEGKMLVDENFDDGAFDSDIFVAKSNQGDTASAKDGAYSIDLNSGAGGYFEVYHKKDHTPVSGGVYVEEFTFDADTGNDLGNFIEFEMFGDLNHVRDGKKAISAGKVSLVRGTRSWTQVATPTGGGNGGSYHRVQWGANGNKDGHRLPTGGSVHVKLVYDLINGKYRIYFDGTEYTPINGGVIMPAFDTGGVDFSTEKAILEPYNLTFTRISLGGSKDGVADHFAISDYKFYEAADRITTQYSTPIPSTISGWAPSANINPVYIMFDRFHDKFTLADGTTLDAGTKLKAYICAYNAGCGTLNAIIEQEIELPSGNSGFWVNNPYNDDAFRTAYKGDVKTIIVYEKGGNLIPVCESNTVGY